MIDVSQWRASIGLWNYCQAASSRPANGHHSHSFKAAVDSKSGSTTSGEKTSKLPAALYLIAFLLLLFHSLSLLRHILMIPPTGKQQLQLCTCIFTGILLLGNCYQVQCTTGFTVTDTNYLQSVVLPGGSSSNLIYNDLYLIVCLRMLLLLSGDVELNPGPMIDDRPDFSLLTQWLEPLFEWKSFGGYLPEITYSDILKIEAANVTIDERKSALYSKWLKTAPKATWADVINALRKARENKLVQDIRRNLQKSAPKSASSYCAVTTRPSSCAEVKFHTAEDEKKILDTLFDLNKEFSLLFLHVHSGLRTKIKNDPEQLVNLIIWLEVYMHWNDKLTNASLDETFKIIHPFYDFIDCSLIMDISEVFLQDFKFGVKQLNIVSELRNYKAKADELRFSAQVKHLHESLKTIYEGHVQNTSNMPMISMKLHNQWHGSSINGLSLLIHNLLPVGHQQSIMKYITIYSGSVIIKYSVHGSTADSLIEYTVGKLQFMHLIGIFSLYINDHPVLQEDENMNFTFELALLEAVTAGNNEAVEFLLQLETVNIDHTNEEGKTALMLAYEKGHKNIVNILHSAATNSNIQDTKDDISNMCELNPGPMIDDRPDISLLTQWLEPLVEWKPFGRCLSGITFLDISKIETENATIDEQKSALYSKWLSIAPKATWADVINSLNKTRENSIFALHIKENLQRSAPLTASSQAEAMFETAAEYEEEVLTDFNIKFSILLMKVRLGLEEKIKNDSDVLHILTMWLEDYMNLNDKLTNISLDEIFTIIYPFYDLIDCSLIVDMSEVFLQDFKFGDDKSIINELENYKDKADELQFLVKVKNLHKSLQTIYEGHIPDTSNMPLISMKLHNPWYGISINGLSLLIHNLLPVGHQQSIMKYITITSGYAMIKYSVYGSTADSLIEYTRKKLQFMYLIGMFSLYIDDHPVLQEDENMNFTFELALLEAVTAGNNEAVEFLLQLVYIDNTNEEGKTALMLACERGHEDIVHSLLSAGANVDIQDNKGLSALMLAGMHNHISIIHMLLEANANPHLTIFDGSNAIMIACQHGSYEVVELLISKGVDYKYQQEDGVNAFMLACQSGHTQIVKLLLKEQVDPSVQNKNGWNGFIMACENGHTQIVKLLLKEQVDPNVQMKGGWNAFMLACLNGHIQIVKMLLKKKVDPNIQRNDGMNALMLACKNGHTKIAELLLKERVDPNVQENNGITALMLARHSEVVKLLLEWKADSTIEVNTAITSVAKADAANDLRKFNLKEDAASVCSFESQRTVSSGHHTVSDISSTRTFPSTLTLDSGIEELTDKK